MSQVPGGTIWVCVDCMLIHANGEIDNTPDKEPWCLWDYTSNEITMGMDYDEHECETDWDDSMHDECDCEHISFSWRQCEGCGSHLGGDRFAFTYWTD
jgi:hypothetical protein